MSGAIEAEAIAREAVRPLSPFAQDAFDAYLAGGGDDDDYGMAPVDGLSPDLFGAVIDVAQFVLTYAKTHGLDAIQAAAGGVAIWDFARKRFGPVDPEEKWPKEVVDQILDGVRKHQAPEPPASP